MHLPIISTQPQNFRHVPKLISFYTHNTSLHYPFVSKTHIYIVWLIHNLSIIYKELRNNATSPIARGMYMCMEMECKRGDKRIAFEGGRTWEKKRGRPPRD